MPIATVDGIDTYYETYGSGSPIFMCAPGGFDATIDKWRRASAWTAIDAIEALAAEHRLSSTTAVSAADPPDASSGSAGPASRATAKRCSII